MSKDQSGAPGINIGAPVVTVQEISSKECNISSQASANVAGHRGFIRGINVTVATTVAVTVRDGTKVLGVIPANSQIGSAFPYWDGGFTSNLNLSYTNGTGAFTVYFKTF